MAQVSDLVKLGLSSTSKSFIYQAVLSRKTLRCAYDRGPQYSGAV